MLLCKSFRNCLSSEKGSAAFGANSAAGEAGENFGITQPERLVKVQPDRLGGLVRGVSTFSQKNGTPTSVKIVRKISHLEEGLHMIER
jgi:hypothetical protein